MRAVVPFFYAFIFLVFVAIFAFNAFVVYRCYESNDLQPMACFFMSQHNTVRIIN